MAGFAGTGLWFLECARGAVRSVYVRCRLPGWRLRPAKRERERREVIRPQFHAPGDECSSR